MCSPCSTGSPHHTGSFASLDDLVRERDELRDLVLEWALLRERQVPHQVRDPVQHDRRDHLVGTDRRLQEAGDAPPRRPSERCQETIASYDVQEAGVQTHQGRSRPRRQKIDPTMYCP